MNNVQPFGGKWALKVQQWAVVRGPVLVKEWKLKKKGYKGVN